jgi:hypothetical protein
MNAALTRFATGVLAVLGVIGLFTAIGFAIAVYKSWVRKTRGPEEAEATSSGGVCASCALAGRKECSAGVAERPDVEEHAKSYPDS